PNLKGFVDGRSVDEEGGQQDIDDDLFNQRFVHGKRFVHS
ncbi:unnamed protein product, partial [Rotaria sp. Silwood1]